MSRFSVNVFGERYPGDDVHGLQLLEEEFTGIGNLDGGDETRRLAVVAPGRTRKAMNKGSPYSATINPVLPLHCTASYILGLGGEHY